MLRDPTEPARRRVASCRAGTRRRVSAALAVLASVSIAPLTAAHPLTFTESELLLRLDGTFQVEMVCDLDALALGVPQDTEDAALVVALHNLTPQQFEERVERLRELFRRRVRVRFDGETCCIRRRVS